MTMAEGGKSRAAGRISCKRGRDTDAGSIASGQPSNQPLEPTVGVGPTTARLRIGCSTTELRRQAKTVTIEAPKCSRTVPFFQSLYKCVATQRLTLIPAHSVTDDRLVWGFQARRGSGCTPQRRARDDAAAKQRRVQGIPPGNVPKAFLLKSAEGSSWNLTGSNTAPPPHPLKEQLASALSNPLALRAGVR